MQPEDAGGPEHPDRTDPASSGGDEARPDGDHLVDSEALAGLFAATGGEAGIASGGAAASRRPHTPGSHHHHHHHHHDAEARRRRRRRRAWICSLSVLGVLVIIAGVAAVAGYTFLKQADSARADLTAAKSRIEAVPGIITSGAKDKAAQLDRIAADVKTHVDRAQHTVTGPMWNIAAKVPWIGANISAVQKTTAAAHILVDDALPPGLQLMSSLQMKNLKLAGGGFNLKPFEEAQASLPVLTKAFAQASAEVSGIDRAALLPQIRDSIGGMLDIIDKTTPTLQTAERVLPTALPMLGSQGPRTYLPIFQNNAEIRATGGNPAASAIVRVNQGKITLADQASSQTFYDAGTAGHSHTQLPPAMLSLYPADTTRYSQNFTRTPNFPTTAKLFTDLWTASGGGKLDGVISVDPVVLSHILAVTGPVGVDGETLTSANVVKAVLSDAYQRFPHGPDSDRFFAAVASAVFTKITAGDWDPAKMLEAFTQSAHEQRLYLWFPVKAEQDFVVEAGLDGQLPASNEPKTEVGVFLNDYSVGKLEYWLTTSVSLTCQPASRQATTTITLRNRIPNGSFSSYVLGLRNGRYGYPRTTMMIEVLYFAPPGARLDAANPANGDVPSLRRTGVEAGRDATSIAMAVGQGQTTTASFTSTLPKTVLGPLSVRYSPTTVDTPVTIAPSCSALFGR